MSWELVESDLAPIALGAAVLGTGGGGSPYLGMLRARELVREGPVVRVLDPHELPEEAMLVTASAMGAPVVSYEKLRQGEEDANAVRALEEHFGRPIDAVAPLELGGGNSMAALVVAAQLGVPVLDGDGMGRGLPGVADGDLPHLRCAGGSRRARRREGHVRGPERVRDRLALQRRPVPSRSRWAVMRASRCA